MLWRVPIRNEQGARQKYGPMQFVSGFFHLGDSRSSAPGALGKDGGFQLRDKADYRNDIEEDKPSPRILGMPSDVTGEFGQEVSGHDARKVVVVDIQYRTMRMTRPVRIAIVLSLALTAPIIGSAATQTIAFDAIPNQNFGISPFPITAKASSGLPVSFVSTTPTVCKTASALVFLLSAGSCQITASQSGNSTYSAATAVSRGFAVDQAGPSGTLTPTSGGSYPFLSGPQSIASGDFNGDGIADLAVATVDGSLWILMGNGSGGFATTSARPYTVGSNPSSVVVGDFNADGLEDLAVANEASASVTVLLGKGSGGFAQAEGSPFTVGPQPYSIAVGDFNGDGIQDLVTTSIDNIAVTLLLGNGQGGFSAAAGSPFAAGASPIAIAVGDFNLGGVPDLAVVNQAAASLSVLIGNGSGGFAAATGSPFPVPGRIGGPASQPSALVVGDFNGDGFPDVAVANYDPSCVTVLTGNGKGSFTAAVGGPFPVGALPYSIVVNDFNGDGIEDIATANRGAENITVMLGGIAPTSSVLSTTSPLTIAAGGSVPLTLTVSDSRRDDPGFNPSWAIGFVQVRHHR